MYPFLCDRVPSGIAEEYRWKMKHNFKQYIYLGLKSGRWEQNRVLTEIWRMEGYVAHKIIKYSNLWSHIYIKFENNDLASNAVDYFRGLDCNLNAELVDNLLCSWYIYENTVGYVGQGTMASVDTVGIAPNCMNPMIEPVLAAVLNDFGYAQVLAIGDAGAQVVFDSMAEALAACIAHGKWETAEQSYCQFYFRVRIVGDNKEAALIGKCLSQEETNPAVQEAFKLDYFVDTIDVGWNTVEEHLGNADVLSDVAHYSSTPSLRDGTIQHGRKIRGRSELSKNQSVFERPPTLSHSLGYQSSIYPTSSAVEIIAYTDYGTPLRAIMVNYGPSLATGNTNYVPNILQEMRFGNGSISSNVPVCNKDTSKNSRHSSHTCNQQRLAENSIPRTGERCSEQSASNLKESSTINHLRTENWSLNQSKISSDLSRVTVKSTRLKSSSVGESSVLPHTKDATSGSEKFRDYEVCQRTGKFRPLEFRSSKFKSSFSQSKHNRKT